MATILYIAGYGRSGSTIVSAVLGAHPEIVAVGEAGFAPDEWADPTRLCSCSRPYQECEVWGPIAIRWRGRPNDLARIRSVDRLSWPPASVDAVERRTREGYVRLQADLFGQAARSARAKVVVDSSKSARLTARRPLALARLAGRDVRVLHLVRDGRSTMNSLVRNGSNWVLEGHRGAYRFPAARAAVGWLWTNLYAARLRDALGPDRYLRVRFEDFVAHPIDTLGRICGFVGVDARPLAEIVERGGEMGVGHMIGGNRLRFAGPVRLRQTEASAASSLGIVDRTVFATIGGALNRRYGYVGAPR